MQNTMAFQYSDPYPQPHGLQPNSYFAKILLESYSGRTSELTAVTQYIYHHLEAGAENGHISGCLRKIGIVEMHHLDLLGGCIRQLGMTPRYRAVHRGRSQYWDARYVSYGRELRVMLEADIQGEYAAIESYNAAIREIREPQICSLLQRIIEDEKLHIEVLEGLLKEL